MDSELANQDVAAIEELDQELREEGINVRIIYFISKFANVKARSFFLGECFTQVYLTKLLDNLREKKNNKIYSFQKSYDVIRLSHPFQGENKSLTISDALNECILDR